MTRGRYCYREVLPFIAMVLVECTNVGLSTIFKAASAKGLNYHVFIVYSFAISALVLVPLVYIFHRKTVLPPFNLSLVGRFFLLAILGVVAQLLGYKGIEYSSPTLGSAMSNLTPACTFVLAIVFRMEKLALRRLSSAAKIIGTIVSITGACIVVLYKGPAVIRTTSPSLSLYNFLSSPQSNWIVGGGLLAADYIIVSVWYIFQAKTVKEYPAEILVVFLYNLACTIVSAPVCFILAPDLNDWKIKADISLAAILYSGIVGAAFGTVIHTWGLHLKGPVYVAMFRPLSIAIAAIMSVIFLGDTLYLGSVIGALVISMGFYSVMWGKTKEDMAEDLEDCGSLESPTSENVPLLQGYTKAEQKHASV